MQPRAHVQSEEKPGGGVVASSSSEIFRHRADGCRAELRLHKRAATASLSLAFAVFFKGTNRSSYFIAAQAAQARPRRWFVMQSGRCAQQRRRISPRTHRPTHASQSQERTGEPAMGFTLSVYFFSCFLPLFLFSLSLCWRGVIGACSGCELVAPC